MTAKTSKAAGLTCVALAALGAAAAIMYGTAPYGLGTYYDSVAYLSAADSLGESGSLLMHDGQPLVFWPPGYPFVVAVVRAVFGVGVMDAARLAGAATLGAIVVTVGAATRWATGSWPTTVVAATFVAFSASTVEISSYALSEPVFTLQYLAVAVALTAAAATGRWWWLGVAAVATGCAILTRFAGVALVPVGMVVAAVAVAGAWWRRIAAAMAFVVVALAPVVPLMVRNLEVSGTLTGARSPATFGLVESGRYVIEGIATWLVPTGAIRIFDLRVALLSAALISLVVVLALWLVWTTPASSTSGDSDRRDPKMTLPLVLAALAIVGIGFLTLASARTKVDPYYQRQLLPFLPGAVIVVAAAVPALRRRLQGHRVEVAWRSVLPVVVGGLVVLNALATLDVVRDNRRSGVGGLTTKQELSVPFRVWVSTQEPGGNVFSNGSELVYLDTGRRVSYMPPLEDLPTVETADPLRVIYYDYGRYPARPPDPAALDAAYDVEVTHEAEGGAVLLVHPRG